MTGLVRRRIDVASPHVPRCSRRSSPLMLAVVGLGLAGSFAHAVAAYQAAVLLRVVVAGLLLGPAIAFYAWGARRPSRLGPLGSLAADDRPLS